MRARVSRKAHFNAAHRLNNPNWSAEKNQQIYGKCNYPNYHGHNYELVVHVTGEIDQESGFVMDLGILKDLIGEYVEEALDHKNLNLDVPEFKEIIPTAENIAKVIFHKLRPHIKETLDLQVTLYETPRNFVTYPV